MSSIIAEKEPPARPQVNVNLDLEQYDRLRREAFERRMSLSELAREAVLKLISELDNASK